MKLLFVVNPISGGRNKQQFLSDAEAFCSTYGIEYAYFNTTGENDIAKLSEAVSSENPDRVVSIGGDGTTLMTSLALQNSDVPFGIIPMGSANGMAKELNVPPVLMDAFKDIVISQLIIPIDLIKVNNNYTMHLGDVGINAEMVEKFDQSEGRGLGAYAKHFIGALKNAELFDVTIEYDGRTISERVYSVLIANTRMYGTGAIINPQGNPHDGKYEIVLIKRNDWTGVMNLGLTIFDRTATERLRNHIEFYLVSSSAIIRFNEEKLLQLDGEVIGKFSQIETTILPGKVNLISTRKNHFIDLIE